MLPLPGPKLNTTRTPAGNAWRGGAAALPLAAAAALVAAASGSTAAAPRQALPAGVRVVLSFGPGSGSNGDLTRDTQLGP